MRNKKFVSAVALFLAALMILGVLAGGLSVLAASQSEINALQSQRDEIRSKQADLKEQMTALADEMDSVIEKKEMLDEQNEFHRQEIELINLQIEIYDEMISAKEVELQDAEDNEAHHYQIYRAHVRAMEENTTWSYVSILFRATSFSDFLSRLDNITEIVQADQRIEEAYKQATEQVRLVKAEYEEVQEEQIVKRYELTTEKARLEKEIEDAYTMILELEEDIEEYEKMFDENVALEAAVQAKIDQKVQELEAQRKAAEAAAAAAAAANKAAGSTGSTGTTNTSTAPAVSGSYTWPVPSSTYITSRFGYRVHPILGSTRYHSGVDVAAVSGATIVAAMGGTVALAEYSASYGNYVVIYHTNGTSTLYAHLSSMAVSAGATVSAGDTIGYCGSTGLSTGPHLHFEVRVNGACVDPLSYYSLAFSYSESA